MASYIPVISRELDLTEYKGIQAGKSRRISVFPDNATTYTSSSSQADVFFSIPSSQGSFIIPNCSQIVFDITANATFTGTDPTLSLSNGCGSSVIQALETIVQNQSVENLLNYNVYANLLADLQPLGRSTTIGTFQGATSTLKAGITLSSTTGVDGPVIRCALPLYSAVLGMGAEQYFPMVDGCRIRMTMATTAVAMKSAVIALVSATSYRLSNFCIQFEVMDLDKATYSALVQQGGGMLKQHCTAVNNYQATLSASTANSILIPARYSSVKALLTTFRLSANLASPDIYNVVGDRLLPQISTYFWNVDGANIPSVPVRVATSATRVFTGEVLSEIQKVFGASNQVSFDSVFNTTQFNNLVGTSGTGSFFLGNNFESQDSAGSALISGRDLNASNVYLNLTHYENCLASVVDTFALYDLVMTYNMQDGSVSMSK
jgi:hypothetical protein